MWALQSAVWSASIRIGLIMRPAAPRPAGSAGAFRSAAKLGKWANFMPRHSRLIRFGTTHLVPAQASSRIIRVTLTSSSIRLFGQAGCDGVLGHRHAGGEAQGHPRSVDGGAGV